MRTRAMRLGLFALCLAGLALPISISLSAQPSYTVTDLGTLGGGRSSAYGINARGQVVGTSETGDGDLHAFVYTDGVMVDLGTLGGGTSYAYRINDAGTIVGRAENAAGLNRAFVALSGGSMIELGSDESGSEAIQFSAALGVNKEGHVIGYLHRPGTHLTAHNRVFRSTGGNFEDLGTFGGEDGIVTAINDAGQMAGSFGIEAHADYADRRAFLATGGEAIQLGTLGGRVTEPMDLNNSGDVVGKSQTATGAFHAFLYASGSLTDLGTLPGGIQSFAYAINNRGDIVGTADAGGTLRAVLYRKGIVTDLNTYLPADSGWVLKEARGINESGQIVGTGIINGQEHAFLLSPR